MRSSVFMFSVLLCLWMSYAVNIEKIIVGQKETSNDYGTAVGYA